MEKFLTKHVIGSDVDFRNCEDQISSEYTGDRSMDNAINDLIWHVEKVGFKNISEGNIFTFKGYQITIGQKKTLNLGGWTFSCTGAKHIGCHEAINYTIEKI
ncbi:hypothetical protein [Arachidicoccus terrestris]|uniref:hypothetical protein n=1 Tax=Arachidicoccus terrestris TaxID=2875539 RepID=UPI001CC720F1|nr:hypothetical protein [Arachidicoccus terrestris]UAY55726.1 hypothetical protein K9M52_01445 [Arachidicoccus terrestris]